MSVIFVSIQENSNYFEILQIVDEHTDLELQVNLE